MMKSGVPLLPGQERTSSERAERDLSSQGRGPDQAFVRQKRRERTACVAVAVP
jgi:hypothetical protein